MRLGFDRAETGDLSPQEMRAMVDALAPRQDRAPGLDQVPDPLPLGPAPAPSASVPVRASRPGSGLSALYAAQGWVVRHSPPDNAVDGTVADKPPQQIKLDEQPSVQALASVAQLGSRNRYQGGTRPPEAPASQRSPDALDPGQVQAALQRGVQAADQAPRAHPGYRLAETGPEDEGESLFEEMLDPLAPVRIAEFNSALARLREIDPKNPNLTYLAPPNWVPSQDAIDRINLEIARIPAAKQAGTAPVRPTWRQSEQGVGVDLGPDHGRQVSYKDHKEADYGMPGSVRPDFVSPDGKSASFEVKNYNINTNMAGLVKAVSEQAKRRLANLPEGMQQKIIIDIRGQSVSDAQEDDIAKQTVQNSNGTILPANIRFER